jgi:hypothetical protein
MYTQTNNTNSLQQGQLYNSFQKKFDKLVGKKKLHLIEQTTSSNLGFIEPMDTIKSSQNKKDNKMISQIKNLENQFNSKIDEYNTIYNNVIQKIKGGIKFKNEVVKTQSGKMYFINNGGIARPFSQTAWTSKPKSCPTVYNLIPDSDINSFEIGLEFAPGQPCNLDNAFITTTENGQEYTYYIDYKGYRHHVPSPILLNELQNGSCKNVLQYNVETNIANMFPQSTPMTSTSTCNEVLLQGSGKNSMSSLKNIHQQLRDLANKMYSGMKAIQAKSNIYNSENDKVKMKLLQEMKSLNDERENIIEMEKMMTQMSGQYEDSQLMYKANLYQYIAWGLLATTLTGLAAHHFMK